MPIDSIDPFTAVGGLRFRQNGWIGEGRARYYASKNRVSLPTMFTVPEHTVIDSLLSYEFNPQFTVSMGVYNIFDLSYWDPQVTRGTLQTASGAGVIGVVPLELYRAPGRTFAVNAVVRW
jgi:hemoglobin/transferrin/lactoferrin receptor protein